MQAIEFSEHGGPEVLRLVDKPDVAPAQGEVAVAIHAASVNAADWKVRMGKSMADATLPHVLGRDFSGVVTEVGPGADLSVGDAVFAVCPRDTEGGYASRIVLPAGLVAAKPPTLSHEEAAAIALAGLTAMISLEDTLKIQPGEKVLIQGGAGGVGGMAVQLAHALGARVIATARAQNHDYVRGLGADEVIDYTLTDIKEALGDCDAALDCVGPHTVRDTFGALRIGGRAAFIATGAEAPAPTRSGVTSLRPAVNRSRALMERVAAHAAAGTFRPPVIETMPLSEARRAHELSQDGHVRGKIVLIPG